MLQSININKAAVYVKNIIDINRCTICGKPNGKRMRYPCGHTSCDDCVPATERCPFCLTKLQDSSALTAPSIDTPSTKCSYNALNLENTFQKEFGVDVENRQRISEQLRVEKELFPQCIQAPAKYYNKRKSSRLSTENKENKIIFFPGEEVSSLSNMENSNVNVREWLNKCVKRKPLGDLYNSRTINTTQKQSLKPLNTQNKDRSYRKRNHSEIWDEENKTFSEYAAPSKKHNKENSVARLEIKNMSTDLQKGKNKDDSGISIDDEVIVVDNSQSIIVDKDLNAWLAVLEAEKRAQCGSTTLGSQESKCSPKITQSNILSKVPFYVKSPLSENCEHCSNKTVNDFKQEQPNISITIESKSFTAIINVSKAEQRTKSKEPNNSKNKNSVEIQTDNLQIDDQTFDERVVSEKEIIRDIKGRIARGIDKDVTEAPSAIPCCSKSEDLFMGEANSGLVNTSSKSSNVIIAESDSDEDVEHSTSLQVTAEVHRSYDEILVLGDVEDIQEHSKRQRRAARGHTPTSTDSSDKENCNPNRRKKYVNSKKKSVKK